MKKLIVLILSLALLLPTAIMPAFADYCYNDGELEYYEDGTFVPHEVLIGLRTENEDVTSMSFYPAYTEDPAASESSGRYGRGKVGDVSDFCEKLGITFSLKSARILNVYSDGGADGKCTPNTTWNNCFLLVLKDISLNDAISALSTNPYIKIAEPNFLHSFDSGSDSYYLPGEPSPEYYKDVKNDDWFYDEVYYVTEHGIMLGVDKNVFAPDATFTRAMAVMVIYRIAVSCFGKDLRDVHISKAGFSDVPDGVWYTDAVRWAKTYKIVMGETETVFGPDDPLTREQTAAMMMRFSKYLGKAVSARSELSLFPDAEDTDGYAVEPMKWAVASGLITGSLRNGEKYLDPSGITTRAQIAAILQRYIMSSKASGSTDVLSSGSAALSDFAVRLFCGTDAPGENVLVSPLSVYIALALLQNGAKGNTLAGMESVLGMSVEDADSFIRSLTDSFADGNNTLSIANSVWFKDSSDFTVNEDFLRTGRDLFGADVFKAPFDAATLSEINGWVDEKTDGMIKKILDNISEDEVMYLINAICFQADWAHKYTLDDVRERDFKCADGSVKKAKLMYSDESLYLTDVGATGFIKYYAGNKYAFAALLPDEGVSLEDYVATLDGARLAAVLGNPQRTRVVTYLPKFGIGYDKELSDVLIGMGMKLPFDRQLADLRGLGTSTENLFVDKVLHKTYISVTETGTRAAAVTAIGIAAASAELPPPKVVCLDRPFLYMIIDTTTNVPIFLGSVNDIGE